jgi:ech hydrogenase subunit B
VNNLIAAIIFIALAPVLGGLVYGVERKVRARMQNRMGPSILQPFYDFFKLLDKRPMMVHSTHAFLGIMHFVAIWFALAVLVLGGDMLVVIFLHLLATALLVVAGYSVRSVFSHLGSTRQALSALAYEPVLLAIAIGFFMVTGSFNSSAVLNFPQPLVVKLPLAFVALLMILPIKLKKSPFDVADAHQEVVGGAEIEYSGIFFEALYTARWVEYMFGYSLVAMFAGANIWLGLGMASVVFILVNAVDNSTARLNYKDMLKISLGVALPLALLNLVFLVL